MTIPGHIPSYVRARSEVRAHFARIGAATRIADCYETGGLRLKLPQSDGVCDGVLINTAGGMTGGDSARIEATAAPHTRLRLTTQSAEKVYRAERAPAEVQVSLRVGERSRLAWMPQETILFDGSRLRRTLEVETTECASLLLFEMTVFGRVARAERMASGAFRDRWRVRRAGRLIFADDVRLDDEIASTLDEAATGAGARAIATLLLVAPDAEKQLAFARELCARARAHCGASAWNDMLIIRFTASDPQHIRLDASTLIPRLMRTKLPRVWAC
ncbi:urease accessory protein UreD [Hyphomicrobium sp. CS1GBMeth3]|uniref:urease accessory protein UreD n=1 Tax=Hyphomicrobium sp. CS1GBMeth3 TaxID=1892845 RepID=UPI000930F13A|nr:urease accessory protein UreD [Hyphomicrobium sp. CS1GBMeth3]